MLIVACGGGAYSGGSNASGSGNNAAHESVAVGPITGFGSVHLNGLQFQTGSATINVDGKTASQDDLRAGQVVEVKSHHDSSTNTDVADDIEFHGNIVGPVSSIDPTAGSLVVLGQSVLVTMDTSFDDDISPASLAGIQLGDLIEVSGLPGAEGSIQATRIERKPAGTSFQVIGTASATDASAKTLQINALVVDFSSAALADFGASGPMDGQLIEATGTTLEANGALAATRLELRTGKQLQPDAGGEVRVEGLITRFAAATDFDVNGQTVTTTPSTKFDGGVASDLALNVRVEVEGTSDSGGLLTATEVQVQPNPQVRIFAQVDAVDATAGTVSLLGMTVSVDAMTRFEDHGSQKVSTFSLTNVHTGDWLEVRGTEASAGSTSVTATRVDRRQPQSQVMLSGLVSSATQPNFMILATTVATTSASQFNHGLNATTFFTGLVGKVASVQGSWDGATLTAQKVQLGEDDED
ncbi:MAG TPA: DUF5666 domain-containing protein [Steroidobacteraceae bacterium]